MYICGQFQSVIVLYSQQSIPMNVCFAALDTNERSFNSAEQSSNIYSLKICGVCAKKLLKIAKFYRTRQLKVTAKLCKTYSCGTNWTFWIWRWMNDNHHVQMLIHNEGLIRIYPSTLWRRHFWPGLGLPSQRPKLSYQKSTLAKIFTEKTIKSVKYLLPLRYEKKKPC